MAIILLHRLCTDLELNSKSVQNYTKYLNYKKKRQENEKINLIAIELMTITISIIQPKHPKMNNVVVGIENIFLHNIGILNIGNLLTLLVPSTDLKRVSVYKKVRDRRGCNLMVHCHLREKPFRNFQSELSN